MSVEPQARRESLFGVYVPSPRKETNRIRRHLYGGCPRASGRVRGIARRPPSSNPPQTETSDVDLELDQELPFSFWAESHEQRAATTELIANLKKHLELFVGRLDDTPPDRVWLEIARECARKIDVIEPRSFSIQIDSQDFDQKARNATLGVAERVNAICDWLIEDRDSASQFILAELLRSTRGDWQDSLVVLAEDTWFDGRQEQGSLINRLLEIASTRRNDVDPGAESVSLAAIRRAASILPVEQLDRLTDFLCPSAVDTVAVTLISLVRIIEAEPLTTSSPHLTNRLVTLVRKYVDPDIYRRGDVDTMLFSGLLLLSVTSPSDFEAVVERLSGLNRPYLFDQLREELLTMREGWETDERCLAYGRIEEAVAAIDRVAHSHK